MRRRNNFLVGPKEKLIEAIKSGKTEEARRYVNDLYEMFRGMQEGTAEMLIYKILQNKSK